MEIENTRKFLKEKLQKDTATLYGFEKERDHIRDLLARTATEGESNSALLISPKQGGKTTVSLEIVEDYGMLRILCFSS